MYRHAMIIFDWDENKNRLNIQKHGLDFVDAQEMFEKPMLTYQDTRKDYLEGRYIGLGHIQKRLMVLVFTRQSENKIRIISFRKANKREQTKFGPTLLSQG